VAEFERVLGLGLGRAILFLRQNDARPYRDAILHACTHWTGYDQQVEGTRTPYLMTVLDETGEVENYVEPILAALKATTDDRDRQQLIRLTSEFAQDGYGSARDALYDLFERDTGTPFSCAHELIRIDGLQGLLHVADRMGRVLLNDPGGLGDDDWIMTSAFHDAEEQCGKADVRRALESAAEGSASVRAYARAVNAILAEMAAQRATESKSRTERPSGRSRSGGLRDTSYERIRQQIGESSMPWSVPRLHLWGQNASAEDLTRAAADLLAEQDVGRLRAYLEIFRQRPFPLEVNRLLQLMRHQNDRIMVGASRALSLVTHPRIRALALEISGTPSLDGWRKSWGVRLLRSNFETDDTELLNRLLEASSDDYGLHSIGFAIVDVLKENLTPEVAPVLRLLYERGPCTNCRKKAVELLRQLDMLPAWLLGECRYDCGEYLRNAADAWSRGEEEPADD
jgi:hypothetical protein